MHACSSPGQGLTSILSCSFNASAAGTRTVIIHQDNEANRPVAPVTEESALLAETTEGQANSKKVFSFERFVFLWLGIGHFYGMQYSKI